MLERVPARTGLAVTTALALSLALSLIVGVSPAAAGEPEDLRHLCDAVGHSCGSTVDDEDGRIIGRHYGVGIGTTLDPEDVDRILEASERDGAGASSSSASSSYSSDPQDLAFLCHVVGHSCGSSIDDGDGRAIGGFYGVGIGSTLDREDVQRILEAATHRYPTWDRMAQCESGGNWGARGYYHGGLQFHPSTWSAHRLGHYPRYAYQATRHQQILVGERVLASQGWGAWPHCSRAIGAR